MVEEYHLRALLAVDQIQVVALSDNNASRLDRAAQRLDGCRRYPDYRAMLEDGAVDIVAVCAPPEFHREMGLAVLDAGKHLFMEKPIALNLDDADRLVERASLAKTKSMVGFNWRRHRLIREAQQMIAGNELGSIVAAHTVFSSANEPQAGSADWRHREDLGGQVLFDLAIHHFDLWEVLIPAGIEEVFARRGADRTGEWVTVSAAMSNGALITSLFSHGVSNVNEMQISGTQGRISFSCYRPDSLRIHRGSAPTGAMRSWIEGTSAALSSAPRIVANMFMGGDVIGSFRDEWHDLAEAIRGDSIVEGDLRAGRRALQVALAAERSFSTNCSEKIDSPPGAGGRDAR